jgi:hypothetical protein
MVVEIPFVLVNPQPKDTVDSLLRLYNKHKVNYSQMVQLRYLIYKLNGKDIFEVGEQIKIPVVFTRGRQKPMSGGVGIDVSRKISEGKMEINYVSPISNMTNLEDIFEELGKAGPEETDN